MSGRICLLFMVGATLGLARPTRVHAQPSCAPREAEGLERAGQAANLEGRHEAALALFRQAYERCRGARALARVALTEAALGRWLDADRHLREAREDARDPWVRSNARALAVEARRIDAHVGSLLLTGAGGPATVEIDGRAVGTWPMQTPARVLAGSVTVVVRAEGMRPVERTLQVAPGSLTREEIALEPRPSPPPAPVASTPPATPPATPTVVAPAVAAPAPPPRAAPPALTVIATPRPIPRPRSTAALRAAAWTSLGLAVVGGSVGIAAVALRASALQDMETPRCQGAAPDVAFCEGRADEADGLRPWIYAGLAVGGVMALTSALTFAFAAPSPERARATAWTCGAGPGSLGLACGAQF